MIEEPDPMEIVWVYFLPTCLMLSSGVLLAFAFL